ncbi:MAG: DoxX family protein [Microbacteriaceae bacterium]
MTSTTLTPSPTLAARCAALHSRMEGFPLGVVQLAMRIGVGSVFFKAGLLKASGFATAVMLFENEYQVPLLAPEVAARIAMVQELALPVLLFLGLGTRLAALPLLGMIGVIQLFVYPGAWTEHLIWSSILVFLMVRGAGPLSLDALIARRWLRDTT